MDQDTRDNVPIQKVDDWSPSSWESKPIKQHVDYKSALDLARSLAKLQRLPPIVTPKEIVELRNQLANVARGDAFLLQGGDCAELFSYCEPEAIDSKIKLLLQMSLVLIWGANKPVVRIARMAGQYAKPRSSATEKLADGRVVPSFRGDILNDFDEEKREPDPNRLVEAYFHSAATMNYIRAQLSSGLADLHQPMNWELGHVKDVSLKSRYSKIVGSIKDSMTFMRTIGADTASTFDSVDLYVSHEALVLEYEQAMTRLLPHPTNYFSDPDAEACRNKGWYNTSAHFVWVGDRTRQIDGAHVEYFRGLENPVGVKVGPTMAADELIALLDIVDPHKQTGKVTLITRYGENKVKDMLGEHIEAVKKSGHVVVWQCDPMHGNTITTEDGIKTRKFASIINEVAAALRIHKEHHSFLGGIHLELTGDAVTECTGGSEGLAAEDLKLNYATYCDPRLNEKQALEMAFLVAGVHRPEASR